MATKNVKQFKSAEFISSSEDEDDSKPPDPKRRRVDESESEGASVAGPSSTTTLRTTEKQSPDQNSGASEAIKSRRVKATRKKENKKGKKPSLPLDKDEEIIKRLKSFVTACGVRKVWPKVFQGLDAPSQKIGKLKETLAELGMTPRYSLEKARKIKAQRELAQELEDVQAFEKAVVGRDSSKTEEQETDEDDMIPAKRKRTAMQSIAAFLQDQSDCESN